MKLHGFTVFAALIGSTAAFAQVYTDPSTGNVGIGTSYPSSKLTVSSTSDHLILRRESSATTGGNVVFLELYQNDSSPFAIPTVYPSIRFHQANRFWTRIEARPDGFHLKEGWTGSDSYVPLFAGNAAFGGNVGIGTTNPSHSLQVQKTSISKPAFMIGGGYYGGPRLQTYGLDADANAWMGLGTDMAGGPYEHSIYFSDYNGMGFLSFGTYNGSVYSEKMRLTRAGNLGIGTTNPTHKLAVNGTIKAKEIIVETTGWSDYVFADDYTLQPLAEVEAHIKTNKHLPGIPSAAEVATDGISLGDMQAKLLAKIEELTLHQIAQQKLLNRQEALLETQAATVTTQSRELDSLRSEVRALRESAKP